MNRCWQLIQKKDSVILNKKSLKRSALFLLLFLSSIFVNIWAQDTLATKTSKLEFLNQIDDRNWHVEIPVWVPGFRGSLAYGGLTLLPEGGDFNVIDRLNGELGITFYLIGNVAYSPGNWLFNIDGFRTTLASGLGFENIDKIKFLVDIEGTILRGLAGYKVIEIENKEKYKKFALYPYGGFRYINLDIYSTNTNYLDIRPEWVEPILGIKAPLQYRRWFFVFKTDVGGFSINNHWSWSVALKANYRFSKLFALGLGYTAMEFNYDQDFEFKYLKLGMRLAGPVLSVQFHF